ncbi:MAG: UDP-N-acetylmuramate--alanine ligase [Glaciecola sp.]|jgi:UDP-N-acetylmuramate--alanine ligase
MTFELSTPRRVHLIGLGGAGMSGIARILLQRGHRVSGSDLKDGRALEALRALGAIVTVGHRASALGDAEVVVRSTAVPASNPELLAAEARNIPVLQRAWMLAALMAQDRRVLIAGTHGKTTTTSMAVVGLQASGLDPSFAIGGSLNEVGTNAHAGNDAVFVAEADESDRSFLAYAPDIAVVTNLELDHPEEFASEEDVHEAFDAFLARRTDGAIALACVDDAGSAALAQRAPGKVVTYGQRADADWRLVIDDGVATVRHEGERVVRLELAVPGLHNLRNATAALATVHLLGADVEAAAAGLRTFQGVQRRFQRLGEVGGVLVIDDYAHHPTELRATLSAARTLGHERVVLVVQPHRYSRTQRFGHDLGEAAAAAEVVIVTDVFASSESPIPGVSGQLVADAARQAGAVVVYEPHLGQVADRVLEHVRPGTLVLVTGAGDVTQVGPAVLQRLA